VDRIFRAFFNHLVALSLEVMGEIFQIAKRSFESSFNILYCLRS